MADRKKRLDSNIAGNFFVDSTCINCDTCRQLAPKSFEEVGEYSAVLHQPEGGEQVHQAYQALLACPVGSIGTEHSEKLQLQAAMASFPLPLEDGVSYCGFNSEKSFGANSFLIEHPEGNWLIDSPRYIKHLIEAFEEKGGLAYIFLTHEDDVAGAEWIIDGSDAVQLATGMQAVPVPGHTPGSMALLYRDKFLFTGDHLWWDPETKTLAAPQRLVWRTQVLLSSIEKLLGYRFEWVLAGHGGRIKRSPDEMAEQLRRLLDQRQAQMAAYR